MHYPIKISDVIPYWLFKSLQDEYYFTGWKMYNVSSDNSGERYSWSINTHQPNQLIFYQIATYIKYRIKKYIKKDLHFIRAHTNLYVYGQTGKFHKDFVVDKIWTFILFTTPNWNIQWGGEFVCYDGKEYSYVPHIPNAGVLIPSNWEHYGSCPNELANCSRTSIGFTFAETDVLKQVLDLKVARSFV
jgi:hypothetical protein